MKTKLVLTAMTVVLAGTPAAFAQMKTTHDRTGSEMGPSKTIQMEGRTASETWSGNSWNTPMSNSGMSGSGMSGSSMSNSGMSNSGMSNSGMSGASGAPGVPTGSARTAGTPPKTIQDRTGSEMGPSPEVLRNDPAFTPSNRPSTAGMSNSNRMGTAGTGMSGSTGMTNQQGYTGSTSGTVSGNSRNVVGSVPPSDLQGRRGRGQTDMELRQTSLLNQFSGAGYIAVRDFRKDGDRYVAQAQDQSGRWAAVELDPRTGTITPR